MALTDSSLLEAFNTSAAQHRRNSRREMAREERTPVLNATERLHQTGKSDDEIVRMVMDLFQEARAHRKPLVSTWNKSYRLLRGRYWDLNSRPQHLPSPQVPEIWPIVRSTVGWLTDRRFHNIVSVAAAPFSAHSSYWEGIGRDLETVMDATWHVNAEEGEVTLSIWDAVQYGTGILKTTWVNSLAGGMGDAKIQRVDPWGFYPDPTARNLDTGNYFIEVKQMSLQELDRRFPGAYKKVGGVGQVTERYDEAPDPMRQFGGTPDYANPGPIGDSSGVYGQAGQSSLHRQSLLHDEGITVFECWVREHNTYTVDVIDPEWSNSSGAQKGGKPKTFKELHVEDGWRVYVVAGQHLILNAKAEEVWDHRQHPYSRYVPYDLGEFWGIGLTELLASSQETINRLLFAAVYNIELLGNPIWVEDNKANISRTTLVSKPGQRVTKNAGGEAGWAEPPKIQSDIPVFLQYFLGRMESISGLASITKGKEPQGRPAEGTMDAVQEAAFVGIRMALRSLEYTLRDAGYKKASLIIQNYTVPRMMAITGATGERSTLSLRARHFMVPTEGGAAPMQYQLLVDAGAGTDTSRKVREDKALTLFGLGALDHLSLYEALQWPNKEEVWQRVQQMLASGMMQQPNKRQKARA